MRKIDLNHVWDDAKAMASANRDLLMAVAGMFILLPFIVADQLMATPPQTSAAATMAERVQAYAQYSTDNLPVLLGKEVFTLFGELAILALLLRPERLTVGQSLRAALLLLPSYFAASLMQSLGAGIGACLFLLPGLYLYARLFLIAPVAAAEQQANPITLLRRSISLTRGNGWRIAALLVVLFLVMMVILAVVTSVVGSFSELLLPADAADLLISITSGIVQSSFSVTVVIFSAALYRATAASTPTPMPWMS